MVAVSILALGTVVIHQNFLRSAFYFGRYTDSLKASLWMDEKMWEVREQALYTKDGAGSSQGSVTLGNKDFDWSQTVKPLAEEGLSSILIETRWREGAEDTHLSQENYVLKTEPPKD